MSTDAPDFESLLREALSPVDPPATLVERLEVTLVNLNKLAHDELESWELSAMRDPRNWVRPVAAATVGVSAGTVLVLLRVSQRRRTRRQQASNVLDLTQRTLQDAAEEARRIVPHRRGR